MPDSQTPRAMAPGSWSDAFAALPDAVPPDDGWVRVARALDAPGRRNRHALPRRRWPLWLAAAAALALIAVVPFGLVDRGTSPPPLTSARPAPPFAAVVGDPAPTPATSARDAMESPPATRQKPAQVESAATGDIAFVPAKPRWRKPLRASARVSATRPPATTQPAPTDTAVPADDALSADAVADAAADPLPQLQAESAQLEALVAFARDERVASASGAVLAGELDTRIGQIDATLSQPDVTSAQRATLWQQRVDALRELAGVETTQRWLAARGERYDGALVRVD